MDFDYDVVIVGGAFSGAATSQLIKRKQPNTRVLIIEKNAEFDRKVGESTTEVRSCFMTRILRLANYLGHEQLAKQGLRMWFCNSPEQKFDDCVEIGPRYGSRVQTFQVDRAKLDSHLLQCAVDAGCEFNATCESNPNRNPEKAFLELPFQGRTGRIAASVIWFYNRRLVTLAKRRLATGHFARNNSGWRELYDGFVPDFRVTKLLRKGLFRWWKAELTNLRLMFVSPVAESLKEPSTASTAEA